MIGSPNDRVELVCKCGGRLARVTTTREQAEKIKQENSKGYQCQPCLHMKALAALKLAAETAEAATAQAATTAEAGGDEDGCCEFEHNEISPNSY